MLVPVITSLLLLPSVAIAAVCNCGGTFTGDAEGTVTSPNSPGNYGNNRNCDYKIEIPAGRVQLTFESMDIESQDSCGYDFVKVYDGSSVDATLLGTVCGTDASPTFTASGNTMFLKFVSDAATDGTGFIANYASMESPCRTYTDATGELTSENHPNDYPNDLRCGQHIQVEDGMNVKVTFSHFDVEAPCNYDSLSVYDGSDDKAERLAELCGTEIPEPITSTGRDMYLYFSTDNSYQQTGFRLTWEAVQGGETTDSCETDPPVKTTAPTTTAPPTPESCGGNHEASENVNITTSNYPSNYPDSFVCSWNIQAAEGKVIRLKFNDFDVEFNRNCRYDFVQFLDGDGLEFDERLCGDYIPGDVISPGNVMTVVFQSDSSVNRRGFSAQFSEETPEAPKDVQCGVATPFHQIVGGQDTRIEEHPWQIWMLRCTSGSCYSCGGSIVSSTWIVSAAHCTANAEAASDFTIYAGSTSGGATESKKFSVKRWIDHPDYDGSVGNDISLLELDGEIDFSSRKTRPICLAAAEDSHTFDNQTCVVTGWGTTSSGGSASDVLQEVSVQVQTREECIRVEGRASYSETHLCAGDVLGGVDSCQGDSGGPLVCPQGDNWVLAGVVSFGEGCALPDHYGFYSRVSNYANWIDETMAS